MRLYVHIMLNAIQSGTTYRFHTFVSTINRFIGLLVQVSLWIALYKGADALHLAITQVSLRDMITYAVFSTSIGLVVSNGNIYALSNRIQTGEIVTNLIRPIGIFRSLLFETAGSKVFTLLFEIVPLLVLAGLFYPVSMPSLIHAAAFGFACTGGFMVYFLLTFIVGLSSFWYLRIFHLDFMLGHMINFFSGAIIPLWFFPKALYNWTSWLPFDLIYYRPLTILLGKADATEIRWILTKDMIWLALLAAVAVTAWMFGRKKLVVQGG